MSSYDQSLLGEAPKATRAQLQEGYSVDLLEQPQPPRRAPSTRHPPVQIPQPASTPAPVIPSAIESNPEEKFATTPYTPAASSKPSFWRSRNGIIIIAVIALVVVGAVVGGAVGGTVKKNSSDAVASSTGSTPVSSSEPSSPNVYTITTTPGHSNGGTSAGSASYTLLK